MGTWHSASSTILQLTANEVDQLFLLLISNPLPQKPHLVLKSPNYFQHISILELVDPSSLIITSGIMSFWVEKRINSNIMTKTVLRHLSFPLLSFCSQSPLTLTFILRSIIPCFHLCHNAEKETAKSKGRSALKKKQPNWLSEKTSASSLLFVFSYTTLQIPVRNPKYTTWILCRSHWKALTNPNWIPYSPSIWKELQQVWNRGGGITWIDIWSKSW